MGSRRTLSAPANDLGLAVAVVALILIGALLAALGSISFVVPADAVDLNAATSEGLAVALEVDLALTDRLVAERERIGRFSSVAEVANVSVIAERDRSSTRTVLRKLDVNAASSGDLATALALPRALAERLTAHRATRPLGRWRSAEDVVRAPVLDPRGVDAMRDRLIVRTPGWALATTLGWALLASALLAPAFGIERRLVPTADRWLLAMAAVPAGLYVAIGVGFQDPLREAVPLGHAVVGLAAGLGIFLVAARTFARRPGGDAAAGTLRSSEQWAVTAFVVWAAGCAATAAGARIGAPGVVWLGPFLAVLVVGVSMRRQAALGPGRLRPGSLGRATRQTSRPLPLLAITAPAWATLVALLVTRDGGVAAMCGVACSLVLYVGNQALWSVAGVVCTASFVWLASLVGLSSAREAVVTWMSPWVAPGSTVPASAQALWAIASGGVWGSGLGLGQPGHGVSGNFAASLSEDLGLLGLAVVLLALTAVVWRCCGVAIRGNGDRDRLLGAVVGGLIAAQSALSVGGATGLLPGMGIPIPFASDSRLLQFVWFGLLGVVCGVSGTLGRVAIGADRVAFRRRLTSIASGFALLTLGP
ncbi:MAG: hypothetical protein FJX72_18245, partial [Armatimonadetes bacterium]|nr:hypothetical protein [Armatimonadota bacterium]